MAGSTARRRRHGLAAAGLLAAAGCAGHVSRTFLAVSSLHRYPIKSCLGEALQKVRLGLGGFEMDRSFAVCLGGQALTQRQCPALASIVAEVVEGGVLRLSQRAGVTGAVEGLPQLEVQPPANFVTVSGSVLGGVTKGIDMGDEAAEWVSAAIRVDDCRLLRRADDCPRRAIGSHWADLAPLLVLTEASMDELSRRAGRHVPISRFRPNIVISGAEAPHAEDRWRSIRIGSAQLTAVGPCARCSIIEVDQDRAAKDKVFSVYGVLAGYRDAGPGQVVFGQYFQPLLIYDPSPVIELGQEVEILK